ncbi:aspartyl/asparaginyl beta-hydroxylase isoform X10 [Coregonus clupeaformis]|uniref:aspartyl/asparaginyl beta-hydroxylase isoform X10 n=1 Tax=Coregonus clupeaformis TaxID=59861 RepID=UPI001E1C90DE|nr:aspartyl/asparaginyl beta-hydroxylase isoform X10 [Coregonus clupeaformis]
MEETLMEEPICEEAILAEEILEVKPAAVVNKNGVKAEAAAASGGGGAASVGSGGAGGGFSGTKIFTWFMVLALLGVWSSVAVVWLDLVDYDNVIARAKEFRFNFSEVLQGKLSAYDADGDGDFDVEDAKVLLDESPGEVASKKNRTKGVKERPVSLVQREAKAESAMEEPAAVPLPPISDDFVPDDSRDEATHPYEDESDAIDMKGELVKEAQPQQTIEESKQYNDQPGFQETQEAVRLQLQYNAEDESVPEPEADVEPELESVPELEAEAVPELKEEPVAVEEKTPQEESEGNAEDQPEDMLTYKAKMKKPKLLNTFEKTIKTEIDAAEKLRKKGKVEEAVRAFDTLVQQYPQSPRCRYGKALAEDDLAEKMRSNDMLQKALSTYKEASELPNATPDLIKATLKKRAERQQFLGRMRGALATLEKLVQIFPGDVALKNDLGVAHLLIGDNKSAKRVYEEVLTIAPSDGFAKVHYGFILKSENKIAESIPFLRDGLESGDPGTDDGRFYFHLGDALQRMGDDSAYKWYEIGHKRGHFASVWQRSLYNVDGLKAQPWWTPKDTGYLDLVKTLERNWRTIRDEALSVMDKTTGLFVPEEENLREKGEWGQFTLWQQGKKAGESCRSVPKTCGLLERYPEATGCKRGQIKFSVMQPGTHVWPHTGPTNCRLRMHLGLVIPKTGCTIRCTNNTRAWEEGKVLIFDDSFEHEVWQDANSYRLIFIVDVWHPELTQYQRQTLSPI